MRELIETAKEKGRLVFQSNDLRNYMIADSIEDARMLASQILTHEARH